MRIFSQPGSSNDPVVTKSYIEEFLKFRIINLMPGEEIILSCGSEIIVRVGKVYVVSEGGILDLTVGVELKTGEKIPLNHYIISPQNGRKIKANTKSILLLRGEILEE
jgi:hypothetical protein